MRIDVTALRFGLAVINIAALGLVCWVAYAFFLGERDELSLAMPNPEEYRVQERKRGAIQNGDLRKVLGTIYRTKPKPPTINKPKVPERDLPPTQGGPLAAEWELISVYSAKGQIMASMQKKTQVATTPSRGSRSKGRSSRPVRPTRTAGKSAKGSTRRGPSLPTKYVVAGKQFLVGEKYYECDKIEFEPKRLYYKDGARLYMLEPTAIETQFSVGEQGMTLQGIPLDDEEAAALEAADGGIQGSIDMSGATKAPVPRTPPKTQGRKSTGAARKKPTRAELEALSDTVKKAGAKAGSKQDKDALRRALQDLDKKQK